MMKELTATIGSRWHFAALAAIITCAAASLTLSGCNPDGTDIGDLYGRWRIVSVTDRNGDIAHRDTLFMAFQGNVYEYQPEWGHKAWGPYERHADSIYLFPLFDQSGLKGMGIPNAFMPKDSVAEAFKVVSLDSKNFVFERNDTTWIFAKYLE